MKLLVFLAILSILSGCEKRVLTETARARLFLVDWFQTEEASERWIWARRVMLSGSLEEQETIEQWMKDAGDHFTRISEDYSFSDLREVENGVLAVVKGQGNEYGILLHSVGGRFSVNRIVSGTSAIDKLFQKEAGISYLELANPGIFGPPGTRVLRVIDRPVNQQGLPPGESVSYPVSGKERSAVAESPFLLR